MKLQVFKRAAAQRLILVLSAVFLQLTLQIKPFFDPLIRDRKVSKSLENDLNFEKSPTRNASKCKVISWENGTTKKCTEHSWWVEGIYFKSLPYVLAGRAGFIKPWRIGRRQCLSVASFTSCQHTEQKRLKIVSFFNYLGTYIRNFQKMKSIACPSKLNFLKISRHKMKMRLFWHFGPVCVFKCEWFGSFAFIPS